MTKLRPMMSPIKGSEDRTPQQKAREALLAAGWEFVGDGWRPGPKARCPKVSADALGAVHKLMGDHTRTWKAVICP